MADHQAPGRNCKECGRPLSRYNTSDDHCGSCRRDLLDLYRGMPHVPAQVWADREVRDALANWDLRSFIGLIRQRSGLHQDDIAQLTGLSQGFLSQVEAGNRQLTKLDKIIQLFDGLGTPAELLPLPSRRHAAGVSESTSLVRPAAPLTTPSRTGSTFLPEVVDSLSVAMLESRPDGDTPLEPSLTALEAQVHEAWQLRQRANYKAMGELLSPLLSTIEHQVGVLDDDRQEQGLRLVVHTYNAASSLFKKLDDTQLGLTAADRAVRIARTLDDPVLVAAAIYRLANVLLVAQRPAEAQRVAVDAATAIEPDKHQEPRRLAMWGGPLLTAAVGAGRNGDEAAAWELLGEARTASKLLQADHADLYSIFGPTNVALHGVQVAVELHNGRTAVERARPVDPDQLPASLLERRSQFLIDLAHGHVLERSDTDAVRTLLRAEQTAPEEVRFSTVAHELLRTMLRRERTGAAPGLRDLADRLDVAC